MIKAIIFDFGDVILFYADNAFFENEAVKRGLPKDAITKLAWDYLNGAHDGTYDNVESYFERKRPNIDLTAQELNKIFDAWDLTFNIDQRMVSYIEVLKREYKIGLLSNFDSGIEDYLEKRFKIDHLFDAIVSSYNIKAKKPNREAYEHILNKLKVKPSEAIFIDDNENYVRGAEAVGVKTILYKNFEQAKTELEAALSRSLEG